MSDIIDNIRHNIINTLFDNWKASIESLNYRINEINPDEYTIRSNGINRLYTTELAMICKGMESMVGDNHNNQEEVKIEVKSHDEKITVVTNVMQNLMGSFMDQFTPQSTTVSTINDPDID